MFDETYAQRDGTIRRETRFPRDTTEWILSGPHFSVANPFHQTPRSVCETNRAYDRIDLENLPEEFLPRTNYVPACSADEYRRRTPKVNWVADGEVDARRVTDFYRLAYRGMLPQSGERTLMPVILPPGAGHIHGVQSTSFRTTSLLLRQAASTVGLVSDFYVKTTGRNNLMATWASLPLVPESSALFCRLLSLQALTRSYAPLWESNWNTEFLKQRWSVARDDNHSGARALPQEFFGDLTQQWRPGNSLRTDYARRQALIEIDVLVAQSIGLTIDELIAIYQVQFPVMRQYESDTWYDQRGRIVFTPSKGLNGVGMPRVARRSDLAEGISYGIDAFVPSGMRRRESGIALGWDDVKYLTTATISPLSSETVTKTHADDTLPGGQVLRTTTYHAPFFKPDREEDYRTAWAYFEKEVRP